MNKIIKQIEQKFNGLSGYQINKLIEYYYAHLGGKDGCEECWETEYLCWDCQFELTEEARRITKTI